MIFGGLFSSMNFYKYLNNSKTFLRAYIRAKPVVINECWRIYSNFHPVHKSFGNPEETQLGLREKGPKERKHFKEIFIEELVKSEKSLTAEQWKDFKAKSGVDNNFESQVMRMCSIHGNTSLGMSLMNYVEAASFTPNLVTLSKYLKLLADYKNENNDAVTEETLLSLYSRIMNNKEIIVDSNTASDLIHGICQTGRWKEAISLLDSIKLTTKSIGTCNLVCIAAAAFRHGEYDCGWDFLEEACAVRHPLLDEGFNCWLEQCKCAPAGKRHQMLQKMLNFLRKHELLVSADITASIKSCFESNLEQKWIGQLTTVSTRGICQACKSSLEQITLENGQFIRLRDNFINRVIEGKDVFLKTTPQELEQFKEFVHRTAPYTIVLDGLNIAYAMKHKRSNNVKLAKQLLTVVEFFARMGKNSRILVLGKQHMLSWPKNILNSIKQEAFVFFVENISKDDPFLLYAAMYSGQGTLVLSKDMMRDHIYCLHDPELASYFRRWQKGHQMEMLSVRLDGYVHYKPALKYNPIVQQCGDDHWHIPYEDGQPKEANESPITWLCMKKE